MAVEGPQPIKWSFPAGADLSSAQYTFLELGSAGTVTQCNADTDRPIGVLQNDPTSGQTAEVVISGVTKVQVDDNLALGDQIETSADGQAALHVPGTDTTKYGVGIIIAGEPTAAGDIITAVIDCAAPGRGA